MPQPTSIHMGHGQMVDIVERRSDHWELVFSEDGVANYQAPPLADIKVEAIDNNGAIHALALSKGANRATVMASGHVAGAYRARVMVMHGDHFHTRESLLPGKSSVAPKQGAHGGSLVQFSTATVEAKLIAADTFELQFTTPPPAPDAVVMQAIGPNAEDYQIRNLAMRAGDKPGTLIASGKVKDAAFLRLTLKSGGAGEVRSVPVLR
jgi:hypothetical protein